MAGVGLRTRVGVWEDAGRWIRVAGVVNQFDVAERAFRMAGVGNGGHRRRRARGFV